MQVEAIMNLDPVSVSRETSLDEALDLMEKGGFRHLPVVEGSEVVGMISDRDLLEVTGWLPARIHATRGPRISQALPRTVREVMSGGVVTAEPSESVEAACAKMVYGAIGCVPVVKDGAIAGIVTEKDLLRLYAEGTWGSRPGATPKVADCMSSVIKTIPWETTLGQALELIREDQIRHLPVVEGGILVGILSDRDLRLAKGRGASETTPIDTYVTRDVLTVEPDRPLPEAGTLMVQHGLSGLPVLEKEELVGILTTTDILEHCIEACAD